ncbi:MFS transporter (plasmid) [Methylosinus trichosporium OB3b]|uniref:MFS transporter n=1 Tax=Methylosinus trichosporium (strain ATCC 35070 / NCIMB 11131 / UNIQEM 75 / OB3b) TaxID=595536 RepID=A0A2D2D751_METT3|nr:MFS transporter [Methylosinus trichosporium OB3b]
MPIADAAPLRGWRFLLLNIVLGLGNVVVLSNVPGYAVVVPSAAGDLQGVTPSFGVWAATDHMMGLALGFALARWLAARFGDYRVLTAAYVFYAAISFACGGSETIPSFVASRILLGLAGGVILPVGQSVLLGEYPESLRTFGVGLWGVLNAMPFMAGIYISGWYTEFLGWRDLLYLNIPVALLISGVVGSLLYGRGWRRRFPRADLVGFLLLAAILYGLQTIFNMGNDFDWFHSPILVVALIIALVALPCFIIWELGERHPVIDMRLFGQRNYAIATICSMAGFFVIMGSLAVFASQLQLILGYSPSLAGGVYLSLLLLSMPSAAIVHELCKRVDIRLICCLNFLGFAVTLTWLGLFDKTASFDQLAWPMTFFGFSFAMFFAPLANLAMHGLQGARLMRAAEEFALLRIVAGGFGIALQGVVLFRRTPYHALDLSDAFGGRRFAELDLMKQLTDKLEPLGFTPAMATSQVGRFLQQEAGLLSLNDVFLLGGVIFVGLSGVVWLARATHPPRLTAAQELKQLTAQELMEQI